MGEQLGDNELEVKWYRIQHPCNIAIYQRRWAVPGEGSPERRLRIWLWGVGL